jgi:DNA polymerase elongation subunit (family B)
MYENKYQEEPVYEAKGIETVRRDGCPAVSKVYLRHDLVKIFAESRL